MSLSNKLAAAALAVTETVQSTVEEMTPSAVAALNTIVSYPPLSIGEIARAVGLTHSATVRLVDRLERDTLVRRQRRVGREVAVEATARGRRRVGQIHDAREKAIALFTDALDEDERSHLSSLLDKLLGNALNAGIERHRLCRMCRRGVCDCHLPCPSREDDGEETGGAET
jgi:DNA-binding MarR family transcriptional regulator